MMGSAGASDPARVMRFHGPIMVALWVVMAWPRGVDSADNGKPGGKERPRPPEELFLREASSKLEDFSFDKNDVKKCERFIKSLGSRPRLPFLLMLSDYYRRYEYDAAKSIRLTGPLVFSKDRMGRWNKSNDEAAKEARENYRKEMEAWTQAVEQIQKNGGLIPDKPVKPMGVYAPLPPVREWDITEGNAAAAVDLARSLMAANQLRQTIEIIEHVGQTFRGENRLLAAECGADLFAKMRTYDKAVEFYGYALHTLNALMADDGYLLNDAMSDKGVLSAWHRWIKMRIERKRAEAKKKLETDRYGPDWVAYRHAEQKRRVDRSYLEAYWMYNDIIAAYPDSVYAEAAQCYIIKTLLALTDKDDIERSREAIGRETKSLANIREKLLAAQKAKSPKSAIQALMDEVEARERKIKAMTAIPVGEKAWTQARKRAESFLKENEWGLYRGEALVALADHLLITMLDAHAAMPYYKRAVDWFEHVKTLDVQLSTYTLPDKAKTVGAPPKSMRKFDVFGNTLWENDHKPGEVFNRRESDWYVDFYAISAIGKYSLCLYNAGKIDLACEYVDALAKYDPFEMELKKAGRYNYFDRLKYQYRQGHLFTEPEFMKDFRGKAKTAMLVCDYYTSLEQWDAALEVIQRMYPLSPEKYSPANCYLYYVEAKIHGVRNGDTEKADRFLRLASGNPKAAIWETAALTYAQNKQFTSEGYMASIAAYKALIDGRGGKSVKEMALYYMAETYYAHGRHEESRRYFNEYLKKYPESDIHISAKTYLDMMEREKKEKMEKAKKEETE